jgi:hypothetical protein
MAKQAKKKKKAFQYPCRCYALGNGDYEMWILDPPSGTYKGPYSCTKEQCIACNMSKARVAKR